MTRYLAITTCNDRQWHEHGHKMATSFARYWPSAVPLRVYAEGFSPQSQLFPVVDLDAAAPWLAPWKAQRTVAQRGVVDGRYNYRFDASRFAHKVAAIGAAAESADCDCLIWLDADIITFDRVSLEWLDRWVMPLSATVGLLDRAVKYPECGFLMFRLPGARPLIHAIVEMYQSGTIFTLAEWHDSFVIGHCVREAVKCGELIMHSFSDPALPKRHPFVNSVLAERMDHLKGTARKAQGRSHRTDLIRPRPEAYWR